MTGTLGGRYALGERLGTGGMADVHRALDRATGRDVAIKLFRRGVEMIDVDRRLRREVELLTGLDHPGLVRVLDADTGDDAIAEFRAYVVMELVDGPTLGARIRREPLTAPQAATVGAALCTALEYVHGRGIVHRDVKPANILLPRIEGTAVLTPKLTDFGVARVIDSSRLTTEGFAVGTANYLSPEQVRGEQVGPASDIYSLGLVLIEAITGEVVYAGHGVEAALARLHRPPRVPGDLGPRLTAVLTRMTARDPHQRPTAAEAGAQLLQAVDPSLMTELLALDPPPVEALTTVIGPGQHRRLPARGRAGLVGAAALALGALAVLAGFLTTGGTATSGVPVVAPSTSRSVAPAGTASSNSAGAVRPIGSVTHSRSAVHPSPAQPTASTRPATVPSTGAAVAHTTTIGGSSHGHGRSKSSKPSKKPKGK